MTYKIPKYGLQLNTYRNWKINLEKDIEDFSPKYILYITIVKMTFKDTGFSEEPSTAYFEISLTEAQGQKEKWKARLHYDFGTQIFVSDSQKGEKFAKTMFQILIDENII